MGRSHGEGEAGTGRPGRRVWRARAKLLEFVRACVFVPHRFPAPRNPTDWENLSIAIWFHEWAKPEISLEIGTNYETYTARDPEIRITVTIENAGENNADLKNVDPIIDPGDLQVINDLTQISQIS